MTRIRIIAGRGTLAAVVAALAVAPLFAADPSPAPSAPSPPSPPATTTTTGTPTGGDVRTHGSIRYIELPELEPDLPPAPGQKLALIACASCHTSRYILHQPPLSADAWLAVVNKMRTTYGAPIDEANVKPLVEYLVAVRGPQTR